MSTKVAINGFGRIGRLTCRALLESGRHDLNLVAINDLGSSEVNAHLFKYDSVHGQYNGEVVAQDNAIRFDQTTVPVFSERDPENLPWDSLGVDIVFECTGIFTSKDKASKHLKAGSKKVLVSAPASGADKTVVFGVNDQEITKEQNIISNASCTTNCLAPIAYVLNKELGIERGFMTTVHSYTGDQPVLDTLHSDLRRARAAALSMIPTSTGAAKAVGLVLPELDGKLDGTAIRVPTPNVSLVDLVFVASRQTTAEEINDIVLKYAKFDQFKNVLGTCDGPFVSTDFNHNSNSSTFDLSQTQVTDGTLCRVLSWYDNEWGFSNRMLDTAACIAKIL